MTADFAWDSFLKYIVVETEMGSAPTSAFLMRFGSEGSHLFDECTVDDVLAELRPDDPNAKENYNSQLKTALKCLKTKFPNCGYRPRRDCTKDVMQWLQAEFPRWLERLISTSAKTSGAENLNAWLRELNYVEQDSQFRIAIDRDSCKGMFLVRTPEELTQRWIAYRLISCIPGYQTAEHHSFKIKLSWKNELAPFWESLAARLEVQSENPESITAALLQRCQTKVVTLTFYGVNRCDQMLIEQLCQLQRQMQSLASKAKSWSGGGLIILLVDGDRYKPSEECLAAAGEQLIQLDCFSQLTTFDISRWLRYPAVQDCLKTLHGDAMTEKLSYLIPSDGQRSSNNPKDVLDDICDTFGLDNGIAEIEPYWELAG